MSQTDLFDIQPVRGVPRVKLVTPAEAAVEALNRAGAYVDAQGRIVMAMPAKWVKTAPHRAGLWLATRGPGRPITVHKAISAFGKLNVLGLDFHDEIVEALPKRPQALKEYACAKSDAELIELMNLWWIGPFPFPPE